LTKDTPQRAVDAAASAEASRLAVVKNMAASQFHGAIRPRPPRVVAVIAAVLALCGVLAGAAGPVPDTQPSPIQRALGFLLLHQVRQPLDVEVNGVRVVDFPGNWPQFFGLRDVPSFRVRDVSPFSVAFIHHALACASETNQRALGLGPLDVGAARWMRQQAAGFMRRFESPPGAPDAGTFGFWPQDADPGTPDLLTTLLLTSWLRGPILGGNRVPINLPIYPSTLALPTDADVTATTYASLLDAANLDGAPRSSVAFERFFVEWRDIGLVPRRLNPFWLPPASGAFLTWLTYRDPQFPLFPNDVDAVVNANVLYALGRHRRLNVPGAAQAVGLINYVTALGLHRGRLQEITDYYPDNLTFHYAVSRAFREGGVFTLAPAVRILADDLEASVLLRPDGTAYWDRGDPHLNTAFAVLTLLNAGRRSGIVDRAIAYLVSEQGPLGGFDEATFFIGRTDGGQVFEFRSASLTTAMVLEALARYRAPGS